MQLVQGSCASLSAGNCCECLTPQGAHLHLLPVAAPAACCWRVLLRVLELRRGVDHLHSAAAWRPDLDGAIHTAGQQEGLGWKESRWASSAGSAGSADRHAETQCQRGFAHATWRTACVYASVNTCPYAAATPACMQAQMLRGLDYAAVEGRRMPASRP